MTNNDKVTEITRDDHENIVNHIYVNHISQLEKDMIGMKKEQEFQGRDIKDLKSLFHELVTEVRQGVVLGRKTYWLMIGACTSATALFAIIKFIVPLIK